MKSIAAQTLALAGDATHAQKLVDDLNHNSPLDTLLQGYGLPTIRANIELHRGNPSKAIEFLNVTRPYELGGPGIMIPVYTRGVAYLRTRNGPEAAREFQKMLDHRTMMGNATISPLTHLGLARARVFEGNISCRPLRLPGFLRSLERRRPRHSNPQRSQGGVREAAIAGESPAHGLLIINS